MLSRRAFLRRTGLTVFAVGPAASLGACHVRTVVDDPAFARAVVLGDSALCVGCRRCEITCSALHHPGLVWPERARLAVDACAEERRFVDGLWFADACHECPFVMSRSGDDDPPACMAACPRDAIRVARLGEGEAGAMRLRVVDGRLCDGCGECVTACPYGTPRVDPDLGRVAICDLCADRPGGPACVEGCPSSALRRYEPWRHMPARPFPWEGAG